MTAPTMLFDIKPEYFLNDWEAKFLDGYRKKTTHSDKEHDIIEDINIKRNAALMYIDIFSNIDLLTDWEVKFFNSMKKGRLSIKQADIIKKIHNAHHL